MTVGSDDIDVSRRFMLCSCGLSSTAVFRMKMTDVEFPWSFTITTAEFYTIFYLIPSAVLLERLPISLFE